LLIDIELALCIGYHSFVSQSTDILEDIDNPGVYPMELHCENLKDKPETFLAFTGLNGKEFQILLQVFTLAWEFYVQQNNLPMELRQRDYGGRKARLATC